MHHLKQKSRSIMSKMKKKQKKANENRIKPIVILGFNHMPPLSLSKGRGTGNET